MVTDNDDPVYLTPKQLVSTSKLSRSLGTYLEAAKKRPLFVTKDSEVEAVLINIQDYRELISEELRVEELYLAVKAVRRLAEHFQSGEALLDTEDVLKEFGFSKETLLGESEDGMDR